MLIAGLLVHTVLPRTLAYAMPNLKMEWPGGKPINYPDIVQVPGVAAVADINLDGTPDIVFMAYRHPLVYDNSILRAIDGKTGNSIFDSDDNFPYFYNSPAIADLEGDGIPEILIMVPEINTIPQFPEAPRVYDSNGVRRYIAQPSTLKTDSPVITAGDLDGDCFVEYSAGSTIWNHDGSIRFEGSFGAASSSGSFSRASRDSLAFADLDGDGFSEVLDRTIAYRHDGTVYWQHENTAGPGFVSPLIPKGNGGSLAVADFNLDGVPEVVYLRHEEPTGSTYSNTYYRFNFDGTLLFSAPSNVAGTITLIDSNSDGVPEIGSGQWIDQSAYGPQRYDLMDVNGNVIWTKYGECEFSNEGAAGFYAGTSPMLAYADNHSFSIIDATNGNVVYTTCNTHFTWWNMPVVADLDGNGKSEVVLGSTQSGICDPTLCSPMGLRVFEDDTWDQPRSIWNMPGYHITNIYDDAQVPPREPASWVYHNTWRVQKPVKPFKFGDVGNTLLMAKSPPGGSNAYMQWDPALGADEYEILFDDVKPFTTQAVSATTPLTDHTLLNIVTTPPDLHFYRIHPDECF